jgi:hypothetical protein
MTAYTVTVENVGAQIKAADGSLMWAVYYPNPIWSTVKVVGPPLAYTLTADYSASAAATFSNTSPKEQGDTTKSDAFPFSSSAQWIGNSS